MPTLKEFQAQLDAIGLTDPNDPERKRRIAEAYRNKELTTEPLPIPSVGKVGAPKLSTGAQIVRDIGDIYTRHERARDPVEMAKEAWQTGFAEKRKRAGEFFHEVETGEAAPTRVAREEAIAAEGQPPPMPTEPQTPSLFDPGAGQVSGMVQQTRPIPMPSSAGMEEAKAERQRGYEEQLARIGTLASKEHEALQKITDVEIERAQAAGKITAERQRQYEQFQADQRQREQSRQDYIKGELSKVQQVVDQVQSMKIDPYSFYKHPDGSTDYPKSIAAVLAVGLGALASSLPAQYGGTGGPNRAMQILDKAIDREIAAQRDDIANKRAGVGLQMNLLSQTKGLLDDERMWDRSMELALLKSFELKLDDALMKTADDKVRANGELLKNQVLQREEALLGDLVNKANDKWVQDEEKAYMLESRTAAAMAKAQAKGPELRKLPPDLEMLPGSAPLSEKSLAEVRKMWTQYPNVRTLLGRLINYRMKEGVTALGQKKFYFDDEFSKARADALDLIVELKQVKGMGAHFTEMEKFLLNIPENPGAFGKWQSSLQRKLQNAEMGKNNFLKAYNVMDISKQSLEGEAAAQ